MLQQDGDGVDGDDGDDFPSPGGNFPGRISLPESFFSLDGFRPVEAAVFFVDDPPILGFPWGRYTRKGNPRVDPGGHTLARRGPTLGRAQVWCGPHLAPPGSSFWLAPSSDVLRPLEKVPDDWSFADMLA